jgi:hypothetical protein
MRKNLFGAMIAAAIVLLAVLGASPAHAANPTAAPAPAAAVVAPSLLPAPGPTANAASGATCPAPTAESTLPAFMAPPAHRLGYCHCGCSSVRTCRTSADCGGASCDQAISCC